MAKKGKISQRMAMSLLPIIGKKQTKREVENSLHTTGKLVTLLTVGLAIHFNYLIWGIAVAVVLIIIGHCIVNAFLEAMYGDGEYSDKNGDTDPLMQLFKTLKDLNEENNLTKK